MRFAVVKGGTQRRRYYYVFVYAVLASWTEVARLNMASRSIQKEGHQKREVSNISQRLDFSSSVKNAHNKDQRAAPVQ